jgi:hypothetical protein
MGLLPGSRGRATEERQRRRRHGTSGKRKAGGASHLEGRGPAAHAPKHRLHDRRHLRLADLKRLLLAVGLELEEHAGAGGAGRQLRPPAHLAAAAAPQQPRIQLRRDDCCPAGGPWRQWAAGGGGGRVELQAGARQRLPSALRVRHARLVPLLEHIRCDAPAAALLTPLRPKKVPWSARGSCPQGRARQRPRRKLQPIVGGQARRQGAWWDPASPLTCHNPHLHHQGA